MAELKTKPSTADVKKFIDSVEDETKRKDSMALLEILQRVTGAKPVMWGDSIVGFGDYRYKYASGREGDWFLAGFAPRKRNLTVYLMEGFENNDKLLAKLGKYKLGKGCIYINKLTDVDTDVLEMLAKESVDYLKRAYPS